MSSPASSQIRLLRHASTKFGPPHLDLLRRVIGTTDINGKGTVHPVERQADPFIFLDEGCLPPGMKPPFGAHPHTGLVANTIPLNTKFEGNLWDNQNGEYGPLRAGGIFQVCSGSGIVHDEGRDVPGSVPVTDEDQWLLQLWFNPGIGGEYQRELNRAEYRIVDQDGVPELVLNDLLKVRVLLGEFGGKRASAETWDAQLLLLDCEFIGGKPTDSEPVAAKVELPSHFTSAWVYNLKGNSQRGTGGAVRVVDRVVADSEDNAVELGEQEIAIRDVDGQAPLADLFEASPALSNIIEISATSAESARPRFFIGAGKPFGLPWYKLLGHDGALVGPSEDYVRMKMSEYQAAPDAFGLAEAAPVA
eukprot:TRINITY_DN42435_c0_g1_i1.p1 TRINITY_DN42435_c0_g1~~TRINITY_DN42435_c0_g1_i1.p1  ORF type:complete len:362 (-),score=53.04 TRINITY_DN42435_c0_g1_i1:102-1187(-)